jgi:hypothetical protein
VFGVTPFHLLPYLEQQALSDPGLVTAGGVTWGACSFGFTTLLFSRESGFTLSTPPAPNGKPWAPDGANRFASITDGMSNNIAERYPL